MVDVAALPGRRQAPAGAARLLAPLPGPGLHGHLERFGPLPPGPDLIGEAHAAGLRGRGGAGFPTAVKLNAVAGRRRPVLVANGTESEPLSAKDKTLLVTAPHLVLDGLVAAAEAVGAAEAIVCVERSATRVTAAVAGAIGERRSAGLDRVELSVVGTPSRFVAGEETALVHWLNGGDAKPTTSPPRPYERGVRGRPTAVQNVETLAHLALIARWGGAWYRSRGTADDPGTTLVTIGGAVERPGVYEIEQGSDLPATVRAAGLAGRPPAVLIGGYFGSWVGGEQATGLQLGAQALRAAGLNLGAGVLWVLPPGACGLAESARVARWMAGQSAGQCGPCANGLPAIASAMEAVVAGRRTVDALAHLQRWSGLVVGRGACHHPNGTARFVASAVEVFGAEIQRHAAHGPCPASAARVLPLPRGDGWR